MKNYHTHTTRCMHAIGSEEEYILAAISAGYTELGFSDHTPGIMNQDIMPQCVWMNHNSKTMSIHYQY